MKVKFKTDFQGRETNEMFFRAKDVVELPDEAAQMLIDDKRAVEVKKKPKPKPKPKLKPKQKAVEKVVEIAEKLEAAREDEMQEDEVPF